MKYFEKKFSVFRKLQPVLLVLGSLICLAAASAQTQSIKPPASWDARTTSLDLGKIAKDIVSRTNRFRQQQGLNKTQLDSQLTKAAQYFADFMARSDRYGHHADNKGPAERAQRYGYAYCAISENIAYQYSSSGFTDGDRLSRRFFQGWKESPGHRKNMLEPGVTDTGVAVAYSKRTGHYYAVQMFGRPRSKMTSFSIANKAGTVVRYALAGRTFTLQPRYTRTHEQCQSVVLTVRWPTQQANTTARPNNGDRFTIRNNAGRFSLSRQ